jgi:hypothetical protein
VFASAFGWHLGLGEKPGPLDRSGQVFTMWNTDAFGWQESTDPIYKSIPFFIDVHRGRALGVFLDNTWRTEFDLGRADPRRYTFSALNGPLTYYLIYGPAPKEVVSAWAWLTGPTPLPPLWALGFQQSRCSYYPESQLRDIADRLRKDRIPCDVLWLDIDFQHENWPFTALVAAVSSRGGGLGTEAPPGPRSTARRARWCRRMGAGERPCRCRPVRCESRSSNGRRCACGLCPETNWRARGADDVKSN